MERPIRSFRVVQPGEKDVSVVNCQQPHFPPPIFFQPESGFFCRCVGEDGEARTTLKWSLPEDAKPKPFRICAGLHVYFLKEKEEQSGVSTTPNDSFSLLKSARFVFCCSASSVSVARVKGNKSIVSGEEGNVEGVLSFVRTHKFDSSVSSLALLPATSRSFSAPPTHLAALTSRGSLEVLSLASLSPVASVKAIQGPPKSPLQRPNKTRKGDTPEEGEEGAVCLALLVTAGARRGEPLLCVVGPSGVSKGGKGKKESAPGPLSVQFDWVEEKEKETGNGRQGRRQVPYKVFSVRNLLKAHNESGKKDGPAESQEGDKDQEAEGDLGPSLQLLSTGMLPLDLDANAGEPMEVPKRKGKDKGADANSNTAVSSCTLRFLGPTSCTAPLPLPLFPALSSHSLGDARGVGGESGGSKKSKKGAEKTGGTEGESAASYEDLQSLSNPDVLVARSDGKIQLLSWSDHGRRLMCVRSVEMGDLSKGSSRELPCAWVSPSAVAVVAGRGGGGAAESSHGWLVILDTLTCSPTVAAPLPAPLRSLSSILMTCFDKPYAAASRRFVSSKEESTGQNPVVVALFADGRVSAVCAPALPAPGYQLAAMEGVGKGMEEEGEGDEGEGQDGSWVPLPLHCVPREPDEFGGLASDLVGRGITRSTAFEQSLWNSIGEEEEETAVTEEQRTRLDSALVSLVRAGMLGSLGGLSRVQLRPLTETLPPAEGGGAAAGEPPLSPPLSFSLALSPDGEGKGEGGGKSKEKGKAKGGGKTGDGSPSSSALLLSLLEEFKVPQKLAQYGTLETAKKLRLPRTLLALLETPLISETEAVAILRETARGGETGASSSSSGSEGDESSDSLPLVSFGKVLTRLRMVGGGIDSHGAPPVRSDAAGGLDAMARALRAGLTAADAVRLLELAGEWLAVHIALGGGGGQDEDEDEDVDGEDEEEEEEQLGRLQGGTGKGKQSSERKEKEKESMAKEVDIPPSDQVLSFLCALIDGCLTILVQGKSLDAATEADSDTEGVGEGDHEAVFKHLRFLVNAARKETDKAEEVMMEAEEVLKATENERRSRKDKLSIFSHGQFELVSVETFRPVASGKRRPKGR
uniref:Uncharacterized protein n=1 Tax=Chromera velia CCMP2878 TaxID=1169474 RepID=A0A0K6SAT2_9ALVE|eukprot:Cvel_11917.t2-p1 / transcript=Cvel_11917.t2 / gene=Cvel_11917 / organism=Chromera_velia_CCMP2878 / gene_product=hypothetical protein / transcript_product=hypothetical protein / location=Cvel_scaffold763:36460-42503(+) / protein_length=1090 / sequence_SO=supercontig / SO=protein_coding / is_pseudo=false